MPGGIRMITGEEMRNARKRMGKTQEQLADDMDISLRQISRFENDKNLRRYKKFLELVVALDLYKRNEEDK